jgi:cell division septum initiation protein DivIVA
LKNLFALNVKIFFLLGIFFSSLHAQDDWTSFYQAKYLEEIEGDFSQALEIYEKLLLKTQDPSLHAIVRYRRARLAELRRDYAFAKKELEELRHCGEEPATTLASERLRFLLEFLASQEIQKTQSTIQELQNELEKLKTISRLHQFESRSIQQQIEKLSQTFHQTLQKFEDTPHTDALKETLSILFEKIQKSQWSEMEPLWKNADSLLQKMKGSSEESKEIRSILSQIQDWIHQQTLPLPPPLSKKIPFSSEERFLQVKRRIRNLSDDFHYLFEHDYAGAQRLLEEIQRELFAHEDLEGEESFRKFFQESKDSLEKFQQALDQVLQHTTQRLAGYDQGNFILKNYREHSVLAELTTGAEYLSHQKGKEGFSDLFYQIPSVSKGEGTEKLIQLIRACFPTYWEHSQAYIRFHKGELHVSQEHSINDSIHSFLKSLGFPNPSPLNLQLTLVAYGNGDLDSFTSTFPVSEIRALHPEGYGLALESVQKKDFFERFLSRSGLPRFQSDILPLKYFRESTIQLYETHEAIVAYRAIQQHFQEVREKYQTGIQLKLIPLPHRSGNLTLSLNLSNQLLKLPLPHLHD